MSRQPQRSCVYNVCTGRATSVLELAAAIGRIAGHPPQVRHGPARAGDIRRSIGNPAAAIAALDVMAKVTLDEGLRPTRSDEQTSELQSLMRITYAVFCLKKKKQKR